MSSTGTIYFALCSQASAMKIGFTSGTAQRRLSQLDNTSAVGELTLSLAVPGNIDDEARLHHKFAADRIRQNREWFRYSGALQAFILERVMERGRWGADRVEEARRFAKGAGWTLPEGAAGARCLPDARRASDLPGKALIDAYEFHERVTHELTLSRAEEVLSA